GSMGFVDADVYLIAVVELATALLLLYPRTRGFGLLMASAYLGGAVAAHLAIHRFTTNDPFVAFMAMHTHIGTLEPGVVLAALWFGTWLSHRPVRGVAATQAHRVLRQGRTQQCASTCRVGSAQMEEQTRVDLFLQYRPLLLSIAYRMLGSMADAEDMVQETFIRWQTSSEAEVRSPRAYLVTILSRLCIHQLESARLQRQQYVGPWLPEPISTLAGA